MNMDLFAYYWWLLWNVVKMCVGSNVEELSNGNDDRAREIDFGWLPSFPHALIASMANFLFGYHIG